MLFKKRAALDTPMDHFLHRDELTTDARADIKGRSLGLCTMMAVMRRLAN